MLPTIYLCRYQDWDMAAFKARHIPCLSSDEQQRLASFKHRDSGHQFLLGRVLLRRQLSELLQCPAAELTFDCNAFGRPYLADSALDFNLSHTEGLVALAVSSGHPVGLDIEARDRRGSVLDIAQRFFHPREFAAISTQPDSHAQRELFFRLWTAKEAYVKALGKGLQGDLKSFCVTEQSDGRLIINTDAGADSTATTGNRTPTLHQVFHYRLWQDYLCSLVLLDQVPEQPPRLLSLDQHLRATVLGEH